MLKSIDYNYHDSWSGSQVQGLQRAGQGIETGGENDDVEFVFPATCPDALFGNFFNAAVGIGIDQKNVILVEGLVVVGVQRLALGAVGVAFGYQLFGYDRVFHGLADLALDVVGAQVVGLLVEEHVLVVGQPEGEAAGVPHPVELALSLVGCGFQHRLRYEGILKAEERFADALDHAVIVRLSRLGHFGVHLAVARRHTVVGGALKHVSCFACCAISGMACTAVAPVPTTATRLLVKSTPVWGQRLVWYHLPLNVSRPLHFGMFVAERLPPAATRYWPWPLRPCRCAPSTDWLSRRIRHWSRACRIVC